MRVMERKSRRLLGKVKVFVLVGREWLFWVGSGLVDWDDEKELRVVVLLIRPMGLDRG